MKKWFYVILAAVLAVGCEIAPQVQKSVSGVTATSATVQKGSDGLTIEQRNVKDRLAQDNHPGAIQHLYVISAYSGQVLVYSTVRGKVTSSGKRLQPTQVSNDWGFRIQGLGRYDTEASNEQVSSFYTREILGDDGTYGSSVEYIYWWDSTGIYHQHYVVGGQIVHVASAPLAVKSIVLNMELSAQ